MRVVTFCPHCDNIFASQNGLYYCAFKVTARDDGWALNGLLAVEGDEAIQIGCV